MKIFLRILLWIFISLTVTLAGVIVAVSVWAAAAPRDISIYNEYIEQSINGSLNGNKVAIGRTYLQWTRDDFLSIKGEGIDYINDDGSLIAHFPKIIFKYDLSGLLRGDLIPTRLKLIRPELDTRKLVSTDEQSHVDFEEFNLGRLSEVTIINGILIAPDSTQWNVPQATLWYSKDAIINAEISKEDGQRIVASVRTNSDFTDSVVKLEFQKLDTNNLIQYIPELGGMRFIANGSASLVANSKEKIASFKVDEMVGALEKPELFRERIVISAGHADGNYDLRKHILDLKAFKVLFDDNFEMSGKALVTDFDAYVADVDFANLQVINFKKYWPVPVAPDAIAWIYKNMSKGLVPSGHLKLNLTPQETETGILSPESIDLTFQAKDVTTTYVDGLAPITNASGLGKMNAEELVLSIGSATVGASKVTRAVVRIYDIGKDIEKLSVDAEAEGQVADVVDYYVKLGKGRKIIKDKSQVTGTAVTHAKVTVPLLKALKIEDVPYEVKTQISDASVMGLLDAVNTKSMKMTVLANNNSYSAVGEAYATYNKTADFSLTNAPLSFEVASKDNALRIMVASDITNSSAEFAPLEIKKSAGQRGKLLVDIIDNGKSVAINKFMVDSDIIRVNAKGSLKPDYSNFSNLNIALKTGDTDLTGRVTNDKFINAEFRGSYLDAAPLIRYLKKDDDGEEDDTEFKVTLRADRIGLLNEQFLRNAYVNLHCAKDCDVISLNSDKVTFNQTNASLVAKAADAGSILKGFDIYTNLEGGQLDISANVIKGDYTNGRITITDFSIVKAQTLAKMLTLGSLTGIADIVRGKGITFKKLASDFEFNEKEISIKEFRMVGAAIGITAKGKIDRKTDEANLSGNIIPAYTANTLLGKIPLIGDVIIGSDGVFALAYSLKGNMDNPELSVNPLSVLAPGFLKNIFQ